MCEHGINVGQMKLSIGQANDSLAQVQQWLEQLHHLADHGGLAESSAQIAQVTVLLGEARAKLESAAELAGGGESGSDVTVELV